MTIYCNTVFKYFIEKRKAMQNVWNYAKVIVSLYLKIILALCFRNVNSTMCVSWIVRFLMHFRYIILIVVSPYSNRELFFSNFWWLNWSFKLEKKYSLRYFTTGMLQSSWDVNLIQISNGKNRNIFVTSLNWKSG